MINHSSVICWSFSLPFPYTTQLFLSLLCLLFFYWKKSIKNINITSDNKYSFLYLLSNTGLSSSVPIIALDCALPA